MSYVINILVIIIGFNKRKGVFMYKTAASFLGVLIALMISANGYLSAQIGGFASLPVIHIVGLVAVTVVLIISKEKKGEGKVPFYLNLGGLCGILLVLFNNRCFNALGASMTLSLGMVGQFAGSVLADSTGFAGMKKYPFTLQKAIGLIILFTGAFVMVESWQGDWLNILLAIISGALVILSMVLNSQLSLRIGVFHGVRRNYLAGLIGTIPVLLIWNVDFGVAANALVETNPLFILTGGTLGVLIVAGSNKVLPKIPVIYSTLLMFIGQALAGLVIDYFISGDLSFRKIVGILIITGGLIFNSLSEKSSVQKEVIA